MGDDDDPFGLSNDAGRTRIRPVASARPAAPVQGAPRSDSSPPKRPRTVENPLISAFSMLLELAPALENPDPPSAVENLRVQLHTQLVQSKDEAVRQGASIVQADAAAWNVAALIDDIVLNTPWGGNSTWPRQTLVSTLYGDVDSGSQFFDRLDELKRYPERDPDLLELTFLCLALGFRGKYRVPGMAGTSSLDEVRQATARALRNPDKDSAPLALNWQGVVAENTPTPFVLPLWTIGIAALVLLSLLYMLLSINLSSRAQDLAGLALRLPPAERAVISRPAQVPDAPQIATPIEPVSFDILPFYFDEVAANFRNVVSGSENVSTAQLRLKATDPELFRSAKADVNAVYLPLIVSIAEVTKLNIDLIGRIVIYGHTDSVPVQRSNPFTTNQGLSEARAKTIALMLADAGVPARILAFQGKADSEPIGDNTTREGRAQNRRVEIVFQKKF